MERQVRNILAVFPDTIIIREIYTGTKFQGRKELEKLLKIVQTGDTIIFDSVSRMSRNADEGFQLYEGLFRKVCIVLILSFPEYFLKTSSSIVFLLFTCSGIFKTAS